MPVVRRGRPRDPARESEILEAALGLVAEVGYDRVSMDAVAAACGASKATIYRRWPSKAAMVAAAVQCRHQDASAPADTGDVRTDLLTGLTSMAASIQSDDVNLLVGLLGAFRDDPELAATMREQMTADKRAAAEEWGRRLVDRGELPPGTDVELVHQIGAALIFFRLLVTGEPVDEAFCTRVVDDALLPLLLRDRPYAGPTAADGSPEATPERTPQP